MKSLDKMNGKQIMLLCRNGSKIQSQNGRKR